MKRWIAGLVCLLMLGLSVGTLAHETLATGSKGDQVKQMQARLKELYYLPDSPDGIYGQDTARAVSAFQAASGLDETGVADEQTLIALYQEDAAKAARSLKRGDKGDDVRLLQERLAFFGFLSGKADGDFGKATSAAVTLFQEHLNAQGHAISVNGALDAATQAFLLDPTYEIYLSDVTPESSEASIRLIQERLIDLNYMEETPDGDFGEYTTDAIRALQRDHGIAESGIADQATFGALYSLDTEPAEYPVPRTIKKGDSGASIKHLQNRLIELGMLSGIADGDYGSATVTALDRLKKYLGEQDVEWVQAWDSTSTLTPALQSRILTDDLPVYRAQVASGSKGTESSRVQRRLNSLYYLIHTNIDGKFGKNSVAALQAFQSENGLEPTGIADEETQKRLFSKDAAYKPLEWKLVVSRPDQRVYAYQLDASGEYQLARTMICSTGTSDSMTPGGIFLKTLPQDRWHYFTKFYCWAQYTYIIDGDIMFHSVLYSYKSESSLRSSSVSMLGRRASHGCIRLSVEDAKWVFETCPAGSVVIVE